MQSSRKTHEIARTAAVRGNAGCKTLQVVSFLEQFPNVVPQCQLHKEFLNGILPLSDLFDVGQGTRQPLGQHSGAHRSASFVHDSQQREVTATVAQSLIQLQTAPSGFINDHMPAASPDFYSHDVWQGCPLCLTNIIQQRSGGSHRRSVIDVKAFKRQSAEVFVQQALAFFTSKTPVRSRCDQRRL